MGKCEPQGTQRYVTLFDFSSQNILHQQFVQAGTPGTYVYDNILQPFWISQGDEFLVILYQDATEGYFYQGGSAAGPYLTYKDMRYCNSCNQNSFPTSVLSNYMYGFPDMRYYVKQEVSNEPMVTVNMGNYIPISDWAIILGAVLIALATLWRFKFR